MYKENTKYKLIGRRPIGVYCSEPREEIAERKNNHWYPYGGNKRLVNFIIESVIEIKENNNFHLIKK